MGEDRDRRSKGWRLAGLVAAGLAIAMAATGVTFIVVALLMPGTG